MKLDERYNHMVCEALVVWTQFRALGYPADDIHALFVDSEKAFGLQVSWKGRHAPVKIGTYHGVSTDQMRREWAEICDDWSAHRIADETFREYERRSRARFEAPRTVINLARLNFPTSPEVRARMEREQEHWH